MGRCEPRRHWKTPSTVTRVGTEGDFYTCQPASNNSTEATVAICSCQANATSCTEALKYCIKLQERLLAPAAANVVVRSRNRSYNAILLLESVIFSLACQQEDEGLVALKTILLRWNFVCRQFWAADGFFFINFAEMSDFIEILWINIVFFYSNIKSWQGSQITNLHNSSTKFFIHCPTK